MKKLIFFISSLFISFVFISCGGSGNTYSDTSDSSSNNTNIQEVTVSGKISNVNQLSIKAFVTANSPIYVIAIDQDYNFYKSGINKDGSFNLNLPKNRNYVFMFQKNTGKFLGTLIVNNYTGITIDQNLNLGAIQIDESKQEAVITDTNKQQEIASKISQNFNIKSPSEIDIKDNSNSIDISLFLSLDGIEGRIAFNNESVSAYINKYYNYNGRTYSVIYIPKPKPCDNPFDGNCYRVGSYEIESNDGYYYIMGNECKLNESTNNWEVHNRNIRIPLFIEKGKEYTIDDNVIVKFPKIYNDFSFTQFNMQTNVLKVDLLPIEVSSNDKKQVLWMSKFGMLLDTNSLTLTEADILNSINGDNINFTTTNGLRFVMSNNGNNFMYIGYGNIINNNLKSNIQNLLNTLPNPFPLPSKCGNL